MNDFLSNLLNLTMRPIPVGVKIEDIHCTGLSGQIFNRWALLWSYTHEKCEGNAQGIRTPM